MSTDFSAEHFVARLMSYRSEVEREKFKRYFDPSSLDDSERDVVVGVRMGQVFALAKEFIDLPLEEIEKLLESPIHEVRAGALSIMGKQASRRNTSAGHLKDLYELYLRHTDRIDNWDLVDISSHHVIGRYLFDKPRDVLYELARSERWWERRIAMFSTMYFVRKGDLDDTFALAEILVDDDHDLVRKVTGGMVREAGKKDRQRLLDFLERHAATMPRVALRDAIEHLDEDERQRYLNMKQAG
jgi:3-methyladenine DNA glycosylase AlkD